jgi:N-acetyl-anhydromuramyl-L-alanine amidase AmpD
MIEAKFYNRLVKVNAWQWIVIHCTESSERPNSARNVAQWFAKPWDGKRKVWVKASAHFVVDAKEVIQCVPEDRIAYHARGLNTRSLGIELVGTAAQTREQWLDDFGVGLFANAARLVQDLARKYSIPLDDEILAAGILRNNGGVTTHKEVTAAYKVPGGHLDPGKNFPMSALIHVGYDNAKVPA